MIFFLYDIIYIKKQEIKLIPLSYKGQPTYHAFQLNQQLTSHIYFGLNQNQNWKFSHNTTVSVFNVVIFFFSDSNNNNK